MTLPTPKLDKTMLKRAALAAWCQTVCAAADGACQRTGAYQTDKAAGRQFKEIAERLAALIADVNQITGPIATPGPSTKLFLVGDQGCDGDDNCPDGQICVDGVCESPFPQ